MLLLRIIQTVHPFLHHLLAQWNDSTDVSFLVFLHLDLIVCITYMIPIIWTILFWPFYMAHIIKTLRASKNGRMISHTVSSNHFKSLSSPNITHMSIKQSTRRHTVNVITKCINFMSVSQFLVLFYKTVLQRLT